MRRTHMYFFVLLLYCFCSLSFPQKAWGRPINQAVMTVSGSDEADTEGRLVIRNNKTIAKITNAGNRVPAAVTPVSDTSLTLIHDRGSSTYLVDRQGNLFDEKTNERIVLDDKDQAALLKYRDYVRSHYYGNMLEWEKASDLIPNKAKFQVIDLETGLSFYVQRRAGKNHADVQPLTKRDTKIMKNIYNGRWSWKRRAILVNTGEQLLAASMHGMPHGADGIPNNGFRGHFCIHFLGSSTHGSRNVDPEHQLLIRKAAGRLEEYLDKASPYEVIDTFITALNLKETHIVKMCFVQANHKQIEFLLRQRDEMTGVAKRSNPEIIDPEGLLTMEIPVELSISRKGRREEKTTFVFQMKRVSVMLPWKIDFIEMT